MCFGLLKKYLAEAKPDFDQIENIEETILEEIKLSASLNKEFGKFKGEFFVMNEPILNKDLGSLNLGLVQQQKQKLERLVHKISEIEENSGKNLSNLLELK